MSLLRSVFASLVLMACLVSLGGCTVSTYCYGYGCGMPDNAGFDAQRFSESGTERPDVYHYRPVW